MNLLVHKAEPLYFHLAFDRERSWVRSEIVNSANPFMWAASRRLLRHEQVHFMISCLLTRQANRALENGYSPQQVLPALEKTIRRIQAQYDADTQHGRVRKKQQAWERLVEERRLEGVLENMLNAREPSPASSP